MCKSREDIFFEMESYYNNVLDAAYPDLKKRGIIVNIHFEESQSINACVEKNKNKKDEYDVWLCTGLYESLKQALKNKYIQSISDEDLAIYKFKLTSFNMFDNSTLKDSFLSVVASNIMDLIFCHECSHILLGHCERSNRMVDGNDKPKVDKSKIGYGHQYREMIADYYGLRNAVYALFFGAKDSSFSISDDKNKNFVYFYIKKIYVNLIVAFYIMADLFEEKETNYKTPYISEQELKNRSHPHPYVRFTYFLEFVREFLIECLSFANKGLSGIESFIDEVINYKTYKDIELMLFGGCSNTSIRSILSSKNIQIGYYQLRKKAFKHDNTIFINFEPKLSKRTLDDISNFNNNIINIINKFDEEYVEK